MAFGKCIAFSAFVPKAHCLPRNECPRNGQLSACFRSEVLMVSLDPPRDAVDAEEAVRRAMLFVRNAPELVHLANLPNEQMRSLCENAVQSISIWDAGEDLPASVYLLHQLGRFGEHYGIPVRELVELLKQILILTGPDRTRSFNAVNAGKRRNLQHSPETFVDAATYYVIRGYGRLSLNWTCVQTRPSG